MTIAISLKINDGLVLAADSASTMMQIQGNSDQRSIVNVYNNANKIFNLVKGLPIGAITWGNGSIKTASISTIVKDLRRRLSGRDPKHHEWKINADNYKVRDVADLFRKFVYEELYVPALEDWKLAKKPATGFIVAGYSSDQDLPEEYLIEIKEDGSCGDPHLLRSADQVGVTWSGEPEALNRLVSGFSGKLPGVLKTNLGVPQEQLPQVVNTLQAALQAPMIAAAMPLQDAIELAEFMVDTTIKFSRFMPGPSTVGGPIEIAAISKHEQFRWVKRKYYFSRELNPTEMDDASDNS